MWWIYPVYIVLMALVTFLSIKLGDMVDLLDKKTKISGAFIGGVLLAAVTSLPEMFTAISSVLIVKNPSLVIGDILGSDIFDLLVISVFTAVFFRNFRKCKIKKFHLISLAVLLVFYALTAYAIFAPHQLMLGDINVISIVIFIGYILLVIFQPKSEEKDEAEPDTSKLSLKAVVILFIVLSIALIGSSIAISLITDLIIRDIGMAGSIGGAIFLGIATSLPEVISTAHLFKLKNYDAGYGNIIGSCTFNYMILALSDFISWENTCGTEAISERGIFMSDSGSQMMTIFGAATAIIIGILIILKCFTKFFEHKKRGLTASILITLITVGFYVCSLIIK